MEMTRVRFFGGRGGIKAQLLPLPSLPTAAFEFSRLSNHINSLYHCPRVIAEMAYLPAGRGNGLRREEMR
jgi:hypothetical protein